MDIAALRVFESSDPGGPFTQIDRTTDVGTYPGYITSYETALASAVDDWFYVAWENGAGDLVYTSSPTLSGAFSIVEQVAERVLQRDPTLDLTLATQEAEAAIEQYYGADPYSITVQPSYRILNGLVYLTLANCYIFSSASSVESASIGMVRFQTSTSSNANVNALIERANSLLGMNTSVVLQMKRIEHWHRREVTIP